MRVFISVDIEGCAGITHWDEAEKGHPDYAEFREIMTGEALAAIEGARAAGAREIVVKDAHDSARNLILERLPADVTVIRGWEGHPFCMMQGLEAGFDACLMIGYHARAGADGNALAHTLSGDPFELTVNGRPASEYLINAYTASTLGVPVALVSGDAALGQEVAETCPHTRFVAVKQGFGASCRSQTPARARAEIRAATEAALRAPLTLTPLPEAPFVLEITYAKPTLAARHRWYPGAAQTGPRRVRLEAAEWLDLLRALNYLT